MFLAGRTACSRHWLLAAVLVACAYWIGCAGSTAVPHNPAVNLGILRGAGSGASVAVLPRASGELVRLALWIDAGSRDANPPQVAALAAWLAADASGSNVVAHVEPEGTELGLWCRKAELARCLGALRRSIAARKPSAAKLDAMRTRLIDARRRAEAADPGRGADRLALQTLFGDRTAGLLPLGVAADDGAASGAAIQQFLAAHYGPNRALLVAVGEVTERDVLGQARTAFAGLAVAQSPRAATRQAPSEGGAAVGVDARDAFSLALTAPDLERAHATADVLLARLTRDGLATRNGAGYTLALRGQALALLRLHAPDPAAATRAATHELERSKQESPPPSPLAPPPETPTALARRLGSRWVAHGGQAASEPISLGIGVLVAGGRADRPSATDPDAAVRERAQERIEAAWNEGRALAAASPSSSNHGGRTSATLENGAHIELRAQTGERIAVAVRFGIGAGSEPPTLHGRAALLATLTATACAGLEPEQLAERTRALGAQIEPSVDAKGWGVVLSAPAAQWQAALALGLDCALNPGLSRANLSAARLRLVARLGSEGGPGELRAEAAELLCPASPGEVAPWGHPTRQASVSLADLRDLWRASFRGDRISVGASGPLPVDEALGWIARRAATVPEKPNGATDIATTSSQEKARDTRAGLAQPTLGIAVWRVNAAHADPAGGQAFAALVRAALSHTPGVVTSWHDGGALDDFGWAAVAVSAPPEQLPAIAEALRAIGRALPADRVARAADAAADLSREHQAEQAPTASAQAEALASGSSALSPTGNSKAARTLAAQLAASEPHWVALR